MTTKLDHSCNNQRFLGFSFMGNQQKQEKQLTEISWQERVRYRHTEQVDHTMMTS